MTQVDLMLIGCGVMAEPYLKAAARRGLRVAVVAPTVRAEKLMTDFDCVVAAEPVDLALLDADEAWIGPTMNLAARTEPRAVVAFSEEHVMAAAIAQRSLGLPGPGFHASVVSRNKALQRAVLRHPLIGHPESRMAAPLESGKWGQDLLPVVVKPISGTGSSGVEHVATAADWADVVSRRSQETVLVEEFVVAQEYSWEALVQQGRIVRSNLTRKTTTGAPNFVELMHESGFEQQDPELGAVADEFGRAVLDGLEMADGIVCVEFRYAPDRGPVLMEAMVRMPGDFLVDSISLGQGIDWFDEVITIALGDTATKPDAATHTASSAVIYIDAPRAGTLVASRTAELETIAGVLKVRDRFALGTVVGPSESSADRLTSVILSCDSRPDLEDAIKAVRSTAHLLVEIRDR